MHISHYKTVSKSPKLALNHRWEEARSGTHDEGGGGGCMLEDIGGSCMEEGGEDRAICVEQCQHDNDSRSVAAENFLPETYIGCSKCA
jgi:hypothetical protein